MACRDDKLRLFCLWFYNFLLIYMRINPRFLIVPALVAGLQAASAGDITGTITLTGTPPPEKVNDHITSVAECAKFHPEPVKTALFTPHLPAHAA